MAEALHNNRIAAIADDITRRYREGGARIVLIAGPSSSGKTTFTKRLAIQLMTNLLEPRMISLDDYFVNREHTPLDADGEYDYESLYALDLEAFNTDLNTLVDGKQVSLPYYNFETGQREYRGNTIELTDNSILLIEGIHGLNPELTASVNERMKYRVYVSPLTTIAQLVTRYRQPPAATHYPRLTLPRRDTRTDNPPLAERAPRRGTLDFPLSGKRRLYVQLLAAV